MCLESSWKWNFLGLGPLTILTTKTFWQKWKCSETLWGSTYLHLSKTASDSANLIIMLKMTTVRACAPVWQIKFCLQSSDIKTVITEFLECDQYLHAGNVSQEWVFWRLRANLQVVCRYCIVKWSSMAFSKIPKVNLNSIRSYPLWFSLDNSPSLNWCRHVNVELKTIMTS